MTMLVALTKSHTRAVQATCVSVLQNLSLNGTFHGRLLERGALEALDSSKDADDGALAVPCATVLYNFSLREQSLGLMLELGGIFLVTHLSYSKLMEVRSSTQVRFLVPASIQGLSRGWSGRTGRGHL